MRWSSPIHLAQVNTAKMLKSGRVLSADLGIATYSIGRPHLQEALQYVITVDAAAVWEFNTPVALRATPNDRRYPDQVDNLNRTGFPAAWDVSPGGVGPGGEPIVIAVLDAGFDTGHEDLAPNLWVNAGEVAGDGLDNDGNGYVDDIHGWNFIGEGGEYPISTHGTQVAGLLGAKGNNGRGIAGTNWDARMMLFSFSTVADVIASYEYVRQQRKRWNDSGGTEGAFVVATNASFGIEGGTCADHPVWGAMYDELGRVGVLTAAATANFSWDVDENGDMPTDCPSDYVIGVANLGPDDRLFTSSAYGRENVDLAAPGQGSYSLLPGDRYGGFGSTSAAAPFVTGAIALLYATPCSEFQDLVKRDPAAAALIVRGMILSGTTSLTALEFRTSSGGMLDVAESQRLLMSTCSDTGLDALSVTGVYPNPTIGEVLLTTNTLVFGEGGRVDVYDTLGRRVSTLAPRRVGSNPVALSVDLAHLPAGLYRLVLRERGRQDVATVLVH